MDERGDAGMKMQANPRGPAEASGRDRGITLVELMVVITILGLMATAAAVLIIPRFKRAKTGVARDEMSQIGSAVEMYMVEVGNLPQSLDDLLHPPEGFDAYLRAGDLNDPWENPYEYEMLDNGKYVIRSYGSDGLEGGSGDAADLQFPAESEEERF
jgi:general secretion pathway protein G